MEIQQIRSFLAVARLGRFAKAADSIHRTQPAVTSAIKALERELGVKLFERRGRRATISPAGEALLSEAGPALQTWEGLKDRLAEHLDGETRGTLRIGAGESSILYLLPAFLEKFRKSNPKVRVILHNQRTADTLKMLKNGELDLGIRSVSSVPAWAFYRPCRTYNRLAVCAKGDPFAKGRGVTLEELSRVPLLFPGSQSITRLLVEEAMTKAGLSYEIGLEAGGWEAIKTYAAAGFGVAVVPTVCLTRDDRRRLDARDASKLFGKDSYGIIIRKGGALPRSARELIRLIDPGFPLERKEL